MSVVVVSYIYLCFFALIFVVLCSQLVALVTAIYYSLVVVVVGVRTHLIFMSRTHFSAAGNSCLLLLFYCSCMAKPK